MGDNETHDFIISDDEDNVSLGGNGGSIVDEGDGDFVISDDDEDYMEPARGERELWLRGLVMNMINALDAKDTNVMVENRDLRRQRNQLMDACDSYVAEEFDDDSSEIETLGEEILHGLIQFFMIFWIVWRLRMRKNLLMYLQHMRIYGMHYLDKNL